MADGRLKIETAVFAREIVYRGMRVMRYHIAYPAVSGCDVIRMFYEELASSLRAYAEKAAEQRILKFDTLPRSERAHFHEMMIRCTFAVLYEDARYISIRTDFVAADKNIIHRALRLVHTFELASGRMTEPWEFVPGKKRKEIPSEDFYLTENGPVFVINLFGEGDAAKPAPGKKVRAEDYFREVRI